MLFHHQEHQQLHIYDVDLLKVSMTSVILSCQACVEGDDDLHLKIFPWHGQVVDGSGHIRSTQC